MRELMEQTEELMVGHVQGLQDELRISRSETYDLEMKEYVAGVEQILYTPSEEGREWLGNQLIDKLCVSKAECWELYISGFRGVMCLTMVVGS